MKPSGLQAGVARLGTIVLAGVFLSGCSALGLFFPEHVHEYAPEAAWASSARVGGCPGSSPALRVTAKDPDWFRIEFGIWDTQQAQLRRLSNPTLFFVLNKSSFWMPIQEKREKVPISVKASPPYIAITLADGSRKEIALPEIGDGATFYRGHTYNIPLEVQPQDLIIDFPDLLINNQLHRFGPVQFKYRESVRYPC